MRDIESAFPDKNYHKLYYRMLVAGIKPIDKFIENNIAKSIFPPDAIEKLKKAFSESING